MYSTCITCHGRLGRNEELAVFPVGERIAFDLERGRLWVVCPHCSRWNLSPLEERWEAIERCERSFRSARLRASTGNIGLARVGAGLELIRIGPAPRAEVAAWRYGTRLLRLQRGPKVAWMGVGIRRALLRGGALISRTMAIPRLPRDSDPGAWWRIHRHSGRIVETIRSDSGHRAIIRYRHLAGAELSRPDRLEPWRLIVPHELGPLKLTSDDGLRSAGKLLAALNGATAPPERVRSALRRLDDAGNPDSYFARVAALALRTSWGRLPDAPRDLPLMRPGVSIMEQLALSLASRSFWAQGGTDSRRCMLLYRLSPEDRLALEIAASEDSERRALAGELAELHTAWQEAEEIAAIADSLFDDRVATHHPDGSDGDHPATPFDRRSSAAESEVPSRVACFARAITSSPRVSTVLGCGIVAPLGARWPG